ncbi:hypothetical protein ACFLRX_09210 [Acidobacteriota bacterium]
MISLAAIVFSVLVGIPILFQFALALGAPWGEYSMGGKFKGRYPKKMRVVAVINAFFLFLVGTIVLMRAQFISPLLYAFSKTAIWFVVGFSVLSIVLNAITKSVWERRIWLPVAIGMLISSLVLALG